MSEAIEKRAIDELDRRLIEFLLDDGRASNRSLAAKLGVNEVTVGSRLRRLESERIMRVVALTDMAAFGYEYIAMALVNVSGRPAADVAVELASIRETISVTVVTGRFDIVATVLARDREDLVRITGDAIRAVEGVSGVRTELASGVLRYDSRWSAMRMEQTYPIPGLADESTDDVDLAIISSLQEDARASNRSIAAALGVSEGTIRSRIKRLEDDGRIRIQPVTDVEVYGLGSHAFIGIHVGGGRVESVCESLLDVPGIVVLFRSIGEFDFIAVVVATTRQDLLATLLGQIQEIPGVSSTETLESAVTPKHVYTWARLV